MSEPPHVERIKYRRTPHLVVTREQSARKDVYGSVGDHVVRQVQLLRGERDSSTVIVAMHPVGSPAYLPLFPELARTGLHVLGCANRYSMGDSALQMENVLLDLGACIRDATGCSCSPADCAYCSATARSSWKPAKRPSSRP